MEPLADFQPVTSVGELEALLRLKPLPAPENRLLLPFDPDRDEYGNQLEED